MQARSFETRALLLLGVSLLALGTPAAAGPQGGSVARGKAVISQSEGRTVIRQSSNRAVIDWTGFDVGREEKVVFDQRGRRSATLNRVDSARPSVIEGAIEAPGTVVLQNGAGVIFTRTARIDAGGLVAASQDVAAGRFARRGDLRIGGGERPGARVENHGEITVGEAGLAALVGGDVENAGSITARRGVVALASGARTTIDFAGDGLIRFAAEGDGAGGVSNSGLIDAGDGRVVLTAGSAARALDAAINTTGVIRATSAGAGGRIKIEGRGAGRVRIGGAVDASGGRGGGAVVATGGGIEVAAGARVSADGGNGGGRIRIGGGARGEGPLRRADHLSVEEGARIAADGGAGVGGNVVFWSEGVTRVDGAISAAGADGGGFVETSGRFALDVGRAASVSVGEGGEWLLDPRDIEIGGGAAAPGPTPPGTGTHRVSRTAIMAALNGGADVTVSTVQPGSSGAGDITVAGPLSWNGAGDLRLEAERDIRVEAPVNPGDGDFIAQAARDIVTESPITAPQAGGVTFDAGRGIVVNHNIRVPGSGAVSLLARTGDISISEARAGNVTVTTTSGPLRLEATQGSVLLRRVNPVGGSNVQVHSDSGAVDVSAGTRILLQGGAQGGRWVRLGQAGSASQVTLRAPEIAIRGGGVGNTFAEVVTGRGGSITMDADRIEVVNGSGDQGRIQAHNGSPLTLRAPSQVWNGPVRAGSGARDGGEVVVAGAVNAGFQPQFSLAPGAGFTFLPATPSGSASRYDSTQPFVVTTSGTGTIEIGAPVTAQEITLESQERVGLGPDGRLTGLSSGDAVTVAAGRRFRNDSAAGSAALAATDPDGRWTLYLDAFAGLTGPEPEPREFDLYGRTYAEAPPSALGYDGNRIVYFERPTLTLTAESLAKTYGQAAAPGFAAAGLRAGDTLATALDGAPEVTSDGAAADAAVRPAAYAVTVAAQASAQGYRLDLAPGLVTVMPAPLTVTADSATRTYGAENPRLAAAVEGFVLGEGIEDLDGALAVSTTATRRSGVGTYAVTAGGLASSNYAISYVDGALAVTPAPLTVTADPVSRAYGSENPRMTATIDGFVLGEGVGDLGGALTVTTSADRRSGVGLYDVTVGGLTSPNYAITYAGTDGALTITPAPLTVWARSATRTYGADNPVLTAGIEGFVLGETLSDLDGALTLTTPATRESGVGAYAVTPGGLSGANYALTFVDGTLTVAPAALTVTAADKTRTYGAANPRLTAEIEGFVLGEGLEDLDGDLALTTDAGRRSGVGRYAITGSGLSSANYAITYADGAFTVAPARLTVSPDAKTRTYGAENPRLTARLDGFVLGEGVDDLDGALTLATAATRGSGVGTYTITGSGLSSANYLIDYAEGALTVAPAPLTVTADPKSRTYGADNPRFTATYDGFVLGEGVDDLGGALTLTTSADRRSGVGRYDVAVGGLTSANYAITYAGAEDALTITPAPLTVRARSQSRTYGADNPRLTAAIEGFVLGEGVGDLDGALTLTTSAARDSDVGRYAITPGGLDAANYDIFYADGALTVTPAPLTVTARAKSRTYGAENPRLTARLSGFVLGETVADLDGALALTTTATRESGVGRYAIEADGLTSANYAISYADAALTITPAPLTVIAEDAMRPEGAANPAFTARYEGFVLGEDETALAGALRFVTEATPASPTGSYAVVPGGLASANYAISYAEGRLAVVPARTEPAPPQGLRASYRIAGRGAAPFTPGDSAFRTTPFEAPPAMAGTFELIYSLGDIPQLAPAADTGSFVPAAGGADTGGFVPAAGGAEARSFAPTAGAAAASVPCAPSAWAGSASLCAPPAAESFWSTTFPGRGR